MTKILAFWSLYATLETLLGLLLTSRLSPENCIFPLLILLFSYAYIFSILLYTLKFLQQMHSKKDYTNPIKLTFLVVTSCLSFYFPLLLNFMLSLLYFRQIAPFFILLIFASIYPLTVSILLPLADLMRIILYVQQYGTNSFLFQYHCAKFVKATRKLYGKSFEKIESFLQTLTSKNTAITPKY